ncbi:DUF3761 domain-containing protein [Streptomyces sp. NPDC004065]|uniref:DUF3761 domain-containing protein n=1 Tax=Streptomyces sp. NPDC004065 TaxID=3364689 RepID=UPI003850250B
MEFTATNTALDLVDTDHKHQDIYPVLTQLVFDLPPGSGKVKCAPRLPAVAKHMKAKRAPHTAAPTCTPTRPATPKPSTHAAPAPAVDDYGGVTARCNDCTLSFSRHHQGTCSHHHGERRLVPVTPPPA